MNITKKPVAILSAAAVAGLIVAAISTPVSAKTTALVVNTNDSKTLEYNFDALKASAVQAALGNQSGATLYNHFIANKVGIKDYYDDVKKAYVDADVVNKAAVDAAIKGIDFNLDTFTEATTTPTTTVTPDKVSVGTDGKIVVTPADPSKQVVSVSAITATTNVGVVATLPSTVNVTLGDGTTKAAAITWNAAATTASTYATAGTVTVNGTLTDYNNYAVSAAVTVTPVTDLAIQSISVNNLQEVVVNFNKPVDKTSVVKGSFKIDAGALAAGDTVKVSDDAKSATITLAAAWTQKSYHNIDVSVAGAATSIKDASGNVMDEVQQLVYANDTTKATVVSSDYAKATDSVTTKFNEPMSSVGTITLTDDKGVVTTVAVANYTFTPGDKKVVFNTGATGLALTDGKQYKITMISAKDLALNISDKYEYTFTAGSTDTVKPLVNAVSLVNPTTLKVTFSEKLSNAGKIDINASGTATALNVVDSADLISSNYDAAVDSTGTVYTIKVPVLTNATVNTIEFSAAKDLAGNTIDTITKNVVLNDTTAPVVKSQTVQDKKLVLTFDEEVTKAASVAGETYIVDPDSVKIAVPDAAVTVDTTDKTKVTVDLSAIVTTVKSGNYALTLGKALLADAYTNSSKYDFTIASTQFGDTVLPAVDLSTAPFITGKVVTVKYTKPMGASAVDINNYTVNGVKVFKSAIFNSTTKDTVELTVNDGAFTVSTDGLLKISTNVKDASNNALKEEYSKTLTFPDTTAPTLLKAEIGADAKTITLTFNEDIDAATVAESPAVADFNIVVGTDKLTGTEAATGNTVTITLGTALTAEQYQKALTVVGTTAMDVADAAGNKVVISQPVTIVK